MIEQGGPAARSLFRARAAPGQHQILAVEPPEIEEIVTAAAELIGQGRPEAQLLRASEESRIAGGRDRRGRRQRRLAEELAQEPVGPLEPLLEGLPLAAGLPDAEAETHAAEQQPGEQPEQAEPDQQLDQGGAFGALRRTGDARPQRDDAARHGAAPGNTRSVVRTIGPARDVATVSSTR